MSLQQRFGLDLPAYDVERSWDTFVTGEYEQEYRGRRMWKVPADLERYRAVAAAHQPQLIIETGTKWGGSALWFRQELGVDVLTIDVQSQVSIRDVWQWPGVSRLVGDSVSDCIVNAARAMSRNYERVMVVLDSDHTRSHVRREISRYGRLVSPGCALVVEDGIFDLVDSGRATRGGSRIPQFGGPLAAVAEVGLDDNPEWRRMAEVEQLTPVSHHPAGWWERL